jgi:glutaminyl-tRNA synthetase
VTTVYCEYLPDTKSGSAGADSVKVKGNIHWVSCKHAVEAKVNLYDRLFKVEHPGANSESYLDDINESSLTSITVQLEENLVNIKPMDQFQFERHGYFICDPDSSSKNIIMNRTVTLRDNWK